MAAQKTTPSGSKKNSKARSSNGSANSTPSRRSATKIKSLRESPLSDDDQDSDDDDDGSAFGEEESESVVDEEDSEESEADQEEDDGITESDEDEEEEVKSKGKGKAQKRKGESEDTVVKKAKTAKDKDEFDEDGRIVTELVQAPKTGHVPDGQISPHLMDFLSKLQIPSNNDREWFARHDAIYRYGWDNWTKFVDKLLPELIENSDETLPYLPSKDCVYRIYRDVRFSNDKTPYKTRMSATFSRGGRKSEDYGGYHIVVGPNNQSALYGGWHDPKNVYRDKIRRSIIDNDDDGKRLKEIVSEESFVEMFGEPRGSGKNKGKGKSGERQNLWGASDELKNAPKMEGVDKTHPEIEWLKLKSYWVQKKFTDEEVLSENFIQLVCEAAKAMSPLVEHLNDFIHPPPPAPEM